MKDSFKERRDKKKSCVKCVRRTTDERQDERTKKEKRRQVGKVHKRPLKKDE